MRTGIVASTSALPDHQCVLDLFSGIQICFCVHCAIPFGFMLPCDRLGKCMVISQSRNEQEHDVSNLIIIIEKLKTENAKSQIRFRLK